MFRRKATASAGLVCGADAAKNGLNELLCAALSDLVRGKYPGNRKSPLEAGIWRVAGCFGFEPGVREITLLLHSLPLQTFFSRLCCG